MAPQSGTTANAANIVVYVSSTDAQSSFATAVNVSPKSIIGANIYAPNGTLLLSTGTTATGAFLGKRITIGRNVVLTLATAFSGSTPSSAAGVKNPGGETLADKGVPSKYVLAQNYPNPFNPSTQIRYGIPQMSLVTLKIYNILGQEVLTLVNRSQDAGYYEVRWDGTNESGMPLGSGLYFARIIADKFTDVRKMILMK